MANYTVEAKDGEEVVKEVKETLSNYFSQKQAAAVVSRTFIYLLCYYTIKVKNQKAHLKQGSRTIRCSSIVA